MSLDTEFMREKTYRARLCLVQVAANDHIFLLDPLSGLDLQPIADLVADPSVEVLVHAGKQDFDIFFERYGVVPANVFDVQLAASFAGYGASLPYGRLVEEILGLPLEKGESYTDWCARPLTESQLRYASDDVRYLPAIAAKLRSQLAEMGRSAWVREEMSVYETPDSFGSRPDEAWKKVTGRGALRPKQVAVLKELARWREETASQRDLPRGWVVKDPTLIELARRAPSNSNDLLAIRGLTSKEVERSGHALLDAIQTGRTGPEVKMPAQPPRSAQQRARMISGLADAIVRSRCDHADIATEVVATRGELESLLLDVFSNRVDEANHRLLRGWRRELAGDAVLALARGEVGVKASPKPPYVEEVSL
ncbi:MAG: ribonuclease [Actinomycetota bacterium]|nr:ribonuclease [Actinomycetota bacterium]